MRSEDDPRVSAGRAWSLGLLPRDAGDWFDGRRTGGVRPVGTRPFGLGGVLTGALADALRGAGGGPVNLINSDNSRVDSAGVRASRGCANTFGLDIEIGEGCLDSMDFVRDAVVMAPLLTVPVVPAVAPVALEETEA